MASSGSRLAMREIILLSSAPEGGDIFTYAPPLGGGLACLMLQACREVVFFEDTKRCVGGWHRRGVDGSVMIGRHRRSRFKNRRARNQTCDPGVVLMPNRTALGGPQKNRCGADGEYK